MFEDAEEGKVFAGTTLLATLYAGLMVGIDLRATCGTVVAGKVPETPTLDGGVRRSDLGPALG